MKVIDLLVKIANGEEVPKKIKWEDTIYAYSEYDKDYLEYPFSNEEYIGLFNMRDNILTQFLNEEVEVIEDTPKEDKKIKHIHLANVPEEKRWFAFRDKINEIIDYINKENK